MIGRELHGGFTDLDAGKVNVGERPSWRVRGDSQHERDARAHTGLADQHCPTIDVKHLTGDEAGVLRAKKQNGAGDLLRLADAAQRDREKMRVLVVDRSAPAADISVSTQPGATEFT